MRLRRHLLFSLSLSLSLSLSAFAQVDPATVGEYLHTELATAEDARTCSASQVSEWSRISNQMQGVWSRDPENHNIGKMVARKPDMQHIIPAGKNWYPNSDEKQILCGTVTEFGYFGLNEMDQITDWSLLSPKSWVDWIASVDFNSLDEADANVFIKPDPAFAYLANDVLPHKKDAPVAGGWHECPGDTYCVEGEITPDEGFYSNPWFKPYDNHTRLNKTMCMYGPWVREEIHGNRPEIHPMEAMWWRESNTQLGPFVMIQMQDDSNRFDRYRDYRHSDLTGPLPATQGRAAETEEEYKARVLAFDPEFKPWSGPPITSEFRIAFARPPASKPLVYFLDSRYHTKVLEADDGALEHTFTLPPATGPGGLEIRDHLGTNPPPPLTVIETSNDGVDRLNVEIVDTCRRGDGTLQGYISLKSKAGDTDRGGRHGEGVHAVEAWGEHTWSRTRKVQVRFESITAFNPIPGAEVAGKTVTFDVNGSKRTVTLTGGKQNLGFTMAVNISDNTPLSIKVSGMLPGWHIDDERVRPDRRSEIAAKFPRSRNFRSGRHTLKSKNPTNPKAILPTGMTVQLSVSSHDTGSAYGTRPGTIDDIRN